MSNYYRYTLVENVRATPSTILLTLKKHHDEVSRLSYQPGQYIGLSFMQHSRPSPTRCFSLVGPPSDEHLQLSMRVAGKFTTALSKLQPGCEMGVRGPYGSFTFDTDLYTSALFIAGGIGITPFISLLSHLALIKFQHPITLLYGVRDQDDVPFYEKLDALHAAHPLIRIVYVIGEGSSDKLKGATTHSGHIDSAIVNTYIDNPSETTAFICGPPPFIGGCIKALNENGITSDRIITEAFNQGTRKKHHGGAFGWTQNIYALGAIGLAASTGAVMFAEILKSLPQNLKPDLTTEQTLSTKNKREQDIDAMIASLAPSSNKKPVSPGVQKILDDTAKAAEIAATTSTPVVATPTPVTSVPKKNTASAPTPAPTTSAAPVAAPAPTPTPAPVPKPVCTTSPSGVTTCQ